MAWLEWLTTTKSPLRRNLVAHPGQLETHTHITPRACNFLPQDVIKRSSGQKYQRADHRRAEMDRFTDTPGHAVTVESVRVQNVTAYLARNSRVAA